MIQSIRCFFGETGIGKSGILKAVKWVLFGKTQDNAFDGNNNI